MLVSTLDFDSYKGTYAIGKISEGTGKTWASNRSTVGKRKNRKCKVEKVFTSVGLKRVGVVQGATGDIVALTGISDITIGQTLAIRL